MKTAGNMSGVCYLLLKLVVGKSTKFSDMIENSKAYNFQVPPTTSSTLQNRRLHDKTQWRSLSDISGRLCASCDGQAATLITPNLIGGT